MLALSETSIPGSLGVVLPQFAPSLALPSLHAVHVLPAQSHPAPALPGTAAMLARGHLTLQMAATCCFCQGLLIPDTNPTLLTPGNAYTGGVAACFPPEGCAHRSFIIFVQHPLNLLQGSLAEAWSRLLSNKGVVAPLLLAAGDDCHFRAGYSWFYPPHGFFPAGVANIKEPKSLLPAGVMQPLPASE